MTHLLLSISLGDHISWEDGRQRILWDNGLVSVGGLMRGAGCLRTLRELHRMSAQAFIIHTIIL